MNPACRLCHSLLKSEPLLRYSGMPKSAQHFPTNETLSLDQPVELVILQCPHCGLVQLANEPVPYFREVIRATAFSAEMGIFRQQQLAEFVDRYQLTNKKAIEIGSGRGEYLELLRQQGLDARGVEYGADAVSACRQQGLTVEQGYIERADYILADGPFDCFFSFNFLEHMPEPGEMLKGLANNLTDGAIGLVEVPNFDMMLRERQFTEFVTDHLSYFTRETLTQLLGMNGFEVLDCQEIWHDYIISATVRKRRRIATDCFHQSQASLTWALHNFIGDLDASQVAVWGAGHQALAVIAMADLAAKVGCVVDSAPFKQNKFTPGTHLSIVAPDDFFQKSTAAALIIMAAGYSDEVAANVRNQSHRHLRIAILRSRGLEVLTV